MLGALTLRGMKLTPRNIATVVVICALTNVALSHLYAARGKAG